MNLADHVAAFLLRPFSHGASVDQVYICLLVPPRYLKTGCHETPLISRGLGIVELATECEEGYLHIQKDSFKSSIVLIVFPEVAVTLDHAQTPPTGGFFFETLT